MCIRKSMARRGMTPLACIVVPRLLVQPSLSTTLSFVRCSASAGCVWLYSRTLSTLWVVDEKKYRSERHSVIVDVSCVPAQLLSFFVP